MSFSYIIERIREAEIIRDPFPHLEIRDFFSSEHFSEIIGAREINLVGMNSDEKLFDTLLDSGYKIIDFPGCITDKGEYIRWHRRKSATDKTNTACEGFGITLRLLAPQSDIIKELDAFLRGAEFQAALAQKFSINEDEVFYDCGIQKYLDGYEISPHPDIRKKALTYMVNVNPGLDTENRDHHTHYLKFKEEYRYVQSFWEGNPKIDRCWVPWDWCEIQKTQIKNNSCVIFSPSNDTMHAVKATYDHLAGQRTQLYGNLWYHTVEIDRSPSWENYVIESAPPEAGSASSKMKAKIKELLPRTIVDALKRRRGGTDVYLDRLKRPY